MQPESSRRWKELCQIPLSASAILAAKTSSSRVLIIPTAPITPDSSGNRKSAFQCLTLPITASGVTFATGSLFNFPMILSRPLVGIWHTRDACTR